MAGPAYYSVSVNIAKNEDWVVPFVYQTSADDITFTPINLTGSVFRLQIRKRETDHQAMVYVQSSPDGGVTPDDGITITDAVNGKFQIVIGRNRLVDLAPGDYVIDLIREMTNGFDERLFEGTATVVEGTTR